MSGDLGRILGVDPGERRTGIAISDPTQTIASAIKVIEHKSRVQAAEMIHEIAREHQVVLIVIGHPLDFDGEKNPQSMKSQRLANEIQDLGSTPITLWDEYGSTQQAQQTRRELDVSRKKRSGHLDEIAAVIILQDYLDSQAPREII